MSRRSILGLICLVLGIVCLVGALALWQSNRSEALEAEASARSVMEQLAPAISRNAQEYHTDLEDPGEQDAAADLSGLEPTVAAIEIDGDQYIGFLTIPDISLELPVMGEWDYDRLKTAPCRYSGSLENNDLTIAAHNYLRHFGHLGKLSLGAEVFFTTVMGNTVRYTVAELEVLPPNATERMTSGEYDLTLFTCTYGGASRFTVRCMRAE